MEEEVTRFVHSLRKIPLFFGLEPDELKTVLELCKHAHFNQHETIFHEGDPSHDMYILLSGSVEISTKKSGVVASLGSSDIFGEIGLITQRTRSASVIATSNCQLFRINHVEFNFLAGRNPRISAILMRNISTNLANHVVRMNNAPLEHIPAQPRMKDKNEIPSQVLINDSE